MTDPRVGLVVTHRRYVPYSHAHYAGNLVDGAYALGLFGDVATEACIRTDGDEGLFASYSDVQFKAPMKAGDVLEITATVVKVGTRSRVLDFTCTVICRGSAALAGSSSPADAAALAGSSSPAGGPNRAESAAEVLAEPIVAVTATGTVVVPPASS